MTLLLRNIFILVISFFPPFLELTENKDRLHFCSSKSSLLVFVFLIGFLDDYSSEHKKIQIEKIEKGDEMFYVLSS